MSIIKIDHTIDKKHFRGVGAPDEATFSKRLEGTA
jgi:hypothetical protein